MRRSLTAWALCTALAWTACSGAPPPPARGSAPRAERPTKDLDIQPIFRSNRPRPHHLTYYLASIDQEEDEVTIDMDLTNGYGRSISSLSVWITLLGPSRERHMHHHPVARMAPHSTLHIITEAKDVTFVVKDIEVGVHVSF